MRAESNDREGAPDAVREVHSLFLTHIDVIRGFIRALVRDDHLADDVLQETFLTVTRKAESFEPGTNFPKWACAIARLKVLEATRREPGRLTFLSLETIELLAASQPRDSSDRRLEVMEHCIGQLPPSMRRMIDLRYVDERKPAQIARLVGWSVNAVYVALSRARGLLRNCVRSKLSGQGERA